MKRYGAAAILSLRGVLRASRTSGSTSMNSIPFHLRPRWLRRHCRILVAVAVVLVEAVGLVSAAAEPPVDYDRQIRPILSDKCFRCHGPDGETREADLRLDRPDGMPDYVIVPGQPDESELVVRITSDDESMRMPPPESHLVLSGEEKALLTRWIAEGGEYTEHWAFRPLPAAVEAPAVSDAAWPRGTLDRFVLARLEKEGLKPSPRANALRLLRRVSLDLTGLPPTPVEIREFQAAAEGDLDAALAAAVDRLLASPAYGEHMAVAWLDAARYADSYGYQSDQLNTQWPYRDWVVRAFNENLPYDEFITWQLAGDMLPNATADQILATAFNRIHRMTNEGGSIAEEWLVENASDRVHTFGTALLGLTVECARCHDHKYDPISQRDYYSLSAFFNSIDENGMYDFATKVPSPSLLLPTAEQQSQLEAARAEIAATEKAAVEAAMHSERPFREWLASEPSLAEVPDLIGYFTFDGDLKQVKNEVPGDKVEVKTDGVKSVAGKLGEAVEFGGDQAVVFPDFFKVDRWDGFTLDFWLRDAARQKSPAVVLHRTAGSDVGFNGFDVTLDDGFLEFRFYRVWPGNGIGVRAKERIAQDEWQHVAVTYAGSSTASGMRLYVNGRELPTTVLRDRMHKSAMAEAHGKPMFGLGARFRDRGFKDGQLDELRVYSRPLFPIEVQHLHDGKALTEAMNDPARQELLGPVYRERYSPEFRQIAARLTAARKKLVEIEDQIQEVPVMEELAEPRPTYMLARGAYDAPKSDANRVTRNTFEDILRPFPEDAPRNRLGLARWMTDPSHPLTARVFVNRVWANFFGRGLVATPENFGRQGTAPTHPEMLDWLARDFVDHGWDVKRLCRQIIDSATYQQDSRLRPELLEKDRENLLLARGPSRRLSAEQIRDLALAGSGLLDPTAGGPPVSPYQPGGDLWKETNEMSPPYRQSTGKALHRRSLYSVWKRTTPLPNMSAFDATTRETCVVARGRTNTPLQALVLLNDVQFVEAARALAVEVSHGHDDLRGRIAEAFLRFTGRNPDATELALLEDIYDEQRALFADGAEQNAAEFLKQGEYVAESQLPPADLAALTAACQVILNLDATIYER
jgi:hypothetical protein